MPAPLNPSQGVTYNYDGLSWRWNGTAWFAIGVDSTAVIPGEGGQLTDVEVKFSSRVANGVPIWNAATSSWDVAVSPLKVTSGYSLSNAVGPGFNDAQPANGDEYCVPIDIAEACTLTQIGVVCTVIGSAGAVFRYAIYDASTGRPGTLILDCGTVASTVTGDKVKTGLTQALSPGRYFFGAVAQGAPVTVPKWAGAFSDMTPPVVYVTRPTSNANRGAWYRSGITGVPPNWTSWGDTSFQPRITLTLTNP